MRNKYSELLVEKVIDELRKARKEQGISHDKLAEKTGLSRAAISYMEAHKRMPTILTCVKIAKALNIKLGDILNHFEKKI